MICSAVQQFGRIWDRIPKPDSKKNGRISGNGNQISGISLIIVGMAGKCVIVLLNAECIHDTCFEAHLLRHVQPVALSILVSCTQPQSAASRSELPRLLHQHAARGRRFYCFPLHTRILLLLLLLFVYF